MHLVLRIWEFFAVLAPTLLLSNLTERFFLDSIWLRLNIRAQICSFYILGNLRFHVVVPLIIYLYTLSSVFGFDFRCSWT
jgi:hypothetical protein